MQAFFRSESLVTVGVRGVLLRQGKKVHFVPRHSPRPCEIPPDCAYLLDQSAASLQRFASGSDAASEQPISLSGLWPAILVVEVI